MFLIKAEVMEIKCEPQVLILIIQTNPLMVFIKADAVNFCM